MNVTDLYVIRKSEIETVLFHFIFHLSTLALSRDIKYNGSLGKF